jgi:DNA-binding Lrp family transcriptional regulator
MQGNSSLPQLELKILQLLAQNARVSFRQVAKLLKVSEATVRYHINKLERKGVIKGYSVIIDPSRIQLPIFITMGVQCEPALTKKVAESIAKSPNFYLVWIVTGAHNIHAKGVFASIDEMQSIVAELTSKIEGIVSYHLSLLFEGIKEPYLLPLELFSLLEKKTGGRSS